MTPFEKEGGIPKGGMMALQQILLHLFQPLSLTQSHFDANQRNYLPFLSVDRYQECHMGFHRVVGSRGGCTHSRGFEFLYICL
jgi:hypothetical protein